MIEIIIKQYLDSHLSVPSFLEQIVIFCLKKQEAQNVTIFHRPPLLFKVMRNQCMMPQI